MVKLALLNALLALMLGLSSSQSAPAYPPSPSPVGSDRITYPPSASPRPPTYPSSVSPSPSLLAHPPTSSIGPSVPSQSTSPPIHAPSISIVPSPSPLPIQAQPMYPPSSTTPAYEPSPSPSTTVAYQPSASPGSPTSTANPPTPSPTSPSPASSPQQSHPPSPSPAVNPPISAPPVNPPSPSPSPRPSSSGLTVGHYKYSCPNAEEIVRQAVKAATDKDRGTGAGLIRLFFHDCFVRGCDASVLLNTTGAKEPTERQGAPNLTLRGFEAIDAAKSALELACPGVVSCADALAFAARDAAFFLGSGAGAASRLGFAMPAGRRDGRVSLASETAPSLPSPSSTLAQLAAAFGAKGLGAADMVALSGAHSVGRARCSSFSARLANSNSGSGSSAMDMDAELARSLRAQCSGGESSMVAQDFGTPEELDAGYYENVLGKKVLFGSDAALMASEGTAGMVLENARVSGLWERRFAAAMVRMGAVGAKTAGAEDEDEGEIRKKCWIVN